MATIPATFETFLAGWNEWDADKRRALFAQSVVPDVEFTDPLHQLHGFEAFLGMVADFQATRPGAVTSRTSGIDLHHDCARYHWAIHIGGTKLIDGFDVVRLDAQHRFRQINGFFGLLTLNG